MSTLSIHAGILAGWILCTLCLGNCSCLGRCVCCVLSPRQRHSIPLHPPALIFFPAFSLILFLEFSCSRNCLGMHVSVHMNIRMSVCVRVCAYGYVHTRHKCRCLQGSAVAVRPSLWSWSCEAPDVDSGNRAL